MIKKQPDEDAIRHDPLLTVSEATRLLHISRSYIYELIGRGILPVVRIGAALRFRPEDIEALIGHRPAKPRRPGRGKKKGAS